MGRRHVDFTADTVARAIKGARNTGVEIRTIRIEPNGAVVINGDNGNITEKELAATSEGYL